MYCKICGNLLDDTDQSCKICGTPVERKEKPLEQAEQEEVIYNPSFDKEPDQESQPDKIDFTMDKEMGGEEEPTSELELRFSTEPEEEPTSEITLDFVVPEFNSEPVISEVNTEPVVPEVQQEPVAPELKFGPAAKFTAESAEADVPFKSIPEFRFDSAPDIKLEPAPEFRPETTAENFSGDMQNSNADQNGKNEKEFIWNVHEFPKSKKTEEIAFNWSSDPKKPSTAQTTEGMSPEALEQLLLKEIRDDTSKNQERDIDKFFTFSKKNEEFQKLLDKEYERLRTRNDATKNFEMTHLNEEPSEPLEQQEEQDVTSPELPQEPAELEVKPEETAKQEQPDPEIEQEQPDPEIESEQSAVESEIPVSASSQLEEMTNARALFFGDDTVKDNEAIKKKLDLTDAREESESVYVSDFEKGNGIEDTAKIVGRADDLKLARKNLRDSQQGGEDAVSAVFPYESEPDDDEKEKKGCLGRSLLILIAIILVAEIAILGIHYFAPGSAAAEGIGNAQTKIMDTVVPWFDHVKGLFSGEERDKDSQDKTPDDPDKATEVSNTDGADDATGADAETPDSSPASDKEKLVESQLSMNQNIKEVKANTTLAYRQGTDYGIKDLNQSKPIENNIWMTPQDGKTVYYDRSLVGTVIAYDSQWIDYVNGGSKSVLDLLKKDSRAYKSAVNFSKVGKIKEEFKLLEIGEIRQGANGFYVWVHEEIQITENSSTKEQKYNWIYYLEPVDGSMKIVNFIKFK